MKRNDRVLYQVEGLPVLQNRVYDTKEEAMACLTGSIKLVQDAKTGIVYNADFHPKDMIYDENYNNEQALSQVFQEHLNDVAGIIERTLGRESLVEIGCGKGYFLELLMSKGFNITGYDPAYVGSNQNIEKRQFDPDIGSESIGLILRHVLEHVQSPVDFLRAIREANGGGGLIYIEVPCFDWILKHKAWFDIFYEHVNYFRMTDFIGLFDQLVDSGWIFGGQYMYVVAELSSLRESPGDEIDSLEFPSDFSDEIEVVHSQNAEATKTVVWGASSKGVIFSLLKQRHGQSLEYAVDINPAKQDKYLPVTGLEVLSPKRCCEVLPMGTMVYVMNSNYLPEIRSMTDNKYIYVSIDND